jgi:hypothetical protein
MGVAFYYNCDRCLNEVYIPLVPFERCDAGEDTPIGWEWDYDTEMIHCEKCKKFPFVKT